mmetsp:Transcript_6164/g.21054  ORF Transcript_6164/g.21054 Transcript_6164/m.21054 type:complete len:674 (-) Transcript_6164:380-2401(-)
MLFIRVSSASRPNWSRSPCTRAYASSTKSMPPRASLTAALVLMAVCPAYPATSPARSTSTICPVRSTPRAASISATMRATVVLPVPGLPVKTMWRAPLDMEGRPAFLRCRSRRSCAWRDLTKLLTDPSPTTPSSLARHSLSFASGSGGAADPSPAPSPPAFAAPPSWARGRKSLSSRVVRESRLTVPTMCTRSVCRPMAPSSMAMARRALHCPRPPERCTASLTTARSAGPAATPRARVNPRVSARVRRREQTSSGVKSGTSTGLASCGPRADLMRGASPSLSPAITSTTLSRPPPSPSALLASSTQRARASTTSRACSSPGSAATRWCASSSRSTPPAAFLMSAAAASREPLRLGLMMSAPGRHEAATRGPRRVQSKSATRRAARRAMVVLPDPALPATTKWLARSAMPPAAARFSFTSSTLLSAAREALAAAAPTRRRSSMSRSTGPRAPAPATLAAPASRGRALTSSTRQKRPKPGLHRKNLSPSFLPSQSLVVRLLSRRIPTTTLPCAKSAGPTYMTSPVRSATCARSPTTSLWAEGLMVLSLRESSAMRRMSFWRSFCWLMRRRRASRSSRLRSTAAAAARWGARGASEGAARAGGAAAEARLAAARRSCSSAHWRAAISCSNSRGSRPWFMASTMASCLSRRTRSCSTWRSRTMPRTSASFSRMALS